jgi:lysine/ornithine N-monooxygenase
MIDTIIIGAGPYGLSIAAHLKEKGVRFCIFGKAMDSWISHMPDGMLLKSDGFASNISDPAGDFTLGQFCAERGIPYRDKGTPIRRETFASYGLAFRDRKLPELEDKTVVSIDLEPNGFAVALDTGETIRARQVILAVGVTHFAYIPNVLANLPCEYVSHSAQHSDVTSLRGKRVAIIGAGSSAIDLAGLMHEAGVDVQLIARKPLKFHSKSDKPRPSWDKVRRPPSGLGPGWKSFFFANYPNIFHHLPEKLRIEAVRRILGPSGGAFIRNKVEGKVSTLIGCSLNSAKIEDGRVRLTLVDGAGAQRDIVADHVIAATGYRVNLEKLAFLSRETRARIRTVVGSPVLSSAFESTISGLYFTGLAAAISFGPVMRFAFGADFTARTVTEAIAKSPGHETVALPAKVTAASSK